MGDYSANALAKSLFGIRFVPKQVKADQLVQISKDLGATRVRALAVGAQGVGALAIGAMAIGTLALAAVAIGRLIIGRAKIKRLEIDELTVRRLRVTGSLDLPDSGATRRRR
jgi:hypothetical protein